VTSIRDRRALQILSSQPQRAAEGAKVVGARAQVVVDEDGVGLAALRELGDDLRRVAHLIRQVEPVGREVAEAAAVVAAARRDQARGREEAVARQQRAARRRVVAIGPARAPVLAAVERLQPAGLDVGEELRPDLHAVADHERVAVRPALVGTRQHVQPAEHDLRRGGGTTARARRRAAPR
jgi:hypothetical protein